VRGGRRCPGVRPCPDARGARSELVRIKALIATTAILTVIVSAVYFLEPEAVNHLWQGRMRPAYLYEILLPFILFELWVHAVIKPAPEARPRRARVSPLSGCADRNLDADHRAGAAYREHGDDQGARLCRADGLFHLLILSTLRLDFWLSTFTGFVAAAELFGMAIFYHPAVALIRARHLLPRGPQHHRADLRRAGRAVGNQLRGACRSIMAATARDRVTNLFGQHVSPQVVERLLTEGTKTGSDLRRLRSCSSTQKLHRGCALALAAGRGRPARRAFAVLVEILDRHGGIVNKFLGDGFLALSARHSRLPTPPPRGRRRREMLIAMERINEPRTGRCASASACISARSWRAISVRPGARNIP